MITDGLLMIEKC